MRARGLVDDAGSLTDTGRKTKERVESLTDELAAPAYDGLDGPISSSSPPPSRPSPQPSTPPVPGSRAGNGGQAETSLIPGRPAVSMVGMSTRLGSYVEWQHAQVSTPRAVLDDLVHRALGTGIDRADRIVDGYSNEVYRVRCRSGQDVVVRVLRFDDDVTWEVSAGEARVIESARSVGVPAPEILWHGMVRMDGSEFPVMVQGTVSGRPLGEVIGRLSTRERVDVLTEIGGLVARLNGVHVDDVRDWSTAMAADLSDRYARRDTILAGGFSAPEFDRMLDLLEEYVREFPCEQWVLCHGDLGPKHIFVTGDGDGTVRVSGIIDFGDWKPGAPVHDLAVLRVRGPDLELPPLLAGYGAPSEERYRRRLNLHTLLVALCSLEIGVDEGDQACIARSGHLIRTLVTDLGG
ncbi:MAG TPA: aminoglycoside phosphotransferase family protein [Actinopolymorphaceae bacterium]